MRSNPRLGLTRSLALFAIPFLAVLLVLPGSAHAQRMTGELSGSVVDESGGVVPGANVTVINEASKAVRRTVTNSDGFFAFAALPATTYTVQIAMPGFNTHEVTGVELRSGDSRSLRQITLKLATVSETVSVSAEVALTPLNSGEKSATLTAEQLENIPIVGTSAAEVLRLLPGMVPNANGTTNRPNFTGEVYGINGNGEYQGGGGNNQSAIGNYNANGGRSWALDITIDGAPGADPGCNCATSVNPNTEFVQEFKVLQANFSAEHAKGPVAMSVISKQGGREFHGSLFTYVRDYHLNSNEWFANKAGRARVQNKFTYPGFTLSGPLVIPGTGWNANRDKVFFFAGFEYFGQRLDTGFVKSWVPTAEMRAGDFRNAPSVGSGRFVNTVPSLGGGVIPANLIDPNGQRLLNVFPQPNADPSQTGGYNYVDNLLVDQNGWQGLARVDFNISDNTKLFMRYNVQRETQPFVIGLWWRNGERQVPYPSAISGKNRSDSVTASLTHVFNPTLTNETIFGVTYIDFPNEFDDRQAISRNALGYSYGGVFRENNDQIPSVDAGSGGPMYFNPGGFDPILFATKWQISAQDNLTKVWGLHTFKLGGYYEYVSNAQPRNNNSNGNMSFNTSRPGSSGNTFADLLMGGPLNSYNEATKNIVADMSYNLFEAYGQDSWKLSPRVTLDYGVRFSYFGPWSDNNGIGMAAWDATKYGDGSSQFPGIVWNQRDSSVPLSGVKGSWFFVTPRAGFAWDIKGSGETVLRGGAGMYRYHEPQSIWSGLLEVGAGAKVYNAPRDLYLRDVEALYGSGRLVFGNQAIDVNDNAQPVAYNWSLTLNQKLPWSTNVELGYVGNRQDELLNENVSNYNAVPLYAMLDNPNANENLYRPLQAYGDLQVFRHSLYTNYHALQGLLSRQRGNFNFTASYTFSKLLGIRGGNTGSSTGLSEYRLDPRQYSYGILGTDRTHTASMSFSWLMKDFKENKALDLFLGGWQFGGVASYVSAAPLQASSSTNFSIQGTNAEGVTINNRNILGSTSFNVYPVLTCDPSQDIPSGYMFNPACFAAPKAGQLGNTVMPYIKGNSYKNLDLSLFKNFSLGSRGHKLQLRISAYNALNHPQWYPDGSANLTLRYTNGVLTAADFGKINENNKYGRRIVQLALRFTF